MANDSFIGEGLVNSPFFLALKEIDRLKEEVKTLRTLLIDVLNLWLDDANPEECQRLLADIDAALGGK